MNRIYYNPKTRIVTTDIRLIDPDFVEISDMQLVELYERLFMQYKEVMEQS